jgi:hypothetical protein
VPFAFNEIDLLLIKKKKKRNYSIIIS